MKFIKPTKKIEVSMSPSEYAGICSTKELLRETVASSDYLHENVIAAAKTALDFLDALTLGAKQVPFSQNITMWIS